jgi:hypothetical protein
MPKLSVFPSERSQDSTAATKIRDHLHEIDAFLKDVPEQPDPLEKIREGFLEYFFDDKIKTKIAPLVGYFVIETKKDSFPLPDEMSAMWIGASGEVIECSLSSPFLRRGVICLAGSSYLITMQEIINPSNKRVYMTVPFSIEPGPFRDNITTVGMLAEDYLSHFEMASEGFAPSVFFTMRSVTKNVDVEGLRQTFQEFEITDSWANEFIEAMARLRMPEDD